MSKKTINEMMAEEKRDMIAYNDFEVERNAILDAIRETIDREMYVKLRRETPEGEDVKLSFSVKVDPENKVVSAVMSGSLKLKQEGFSDWSGVTGDLFEYAAEQQ